ncbi:MAG TPA: phenylalanine--tRNA ligase subunit beta [Phycisphaerales bacterium]|nr:phenylalanine--tRNA ligase subunit beta [Phycisphaerales bacterium]
MHCSIPWLNRYLSPGDVSAAEAERLLTAAGFPIETAVALPSGDTMLDVEVTSNRGDCLSHLGLAREVAAGSGRALVKPAWQDPPAAGRSSELLTLKNTTPEACPLFTAQVVRGVKVGPSPAWLAELLEAVGQRPINNVVDVTNFITFELGHPCHVFDLRKLAGSTLLIRWAEEGEKLRTLDGKDRVLKADELVVADSQRAQSLAGVIGGADSEVDERTTDVVLEMATWDPVTIRRAARRLAIRTDAAHRFERIVDPREIAYAARRAAALLVEVAGGRLLEGVSDGLPPKPHTTVELRTQRARDLIGIDIPDAEQADLLSRLEIAVESTPSGSPSPTHSLTPVRPGVLLCHIPPFRHDLTREADLIEEIARTKGLDAIPILGRMPVVAKRPQERESAVRAIGQTLGGLGFYETVTFTFVTEAQARPFLPPELRLIAVDDERRKHEPYLRPSVIPSLLACRRTNQNGQVEQPGGVRLWEIASVFAEWDRPGREAVENRNLTLLMDVPGEGRKRTPDDRQAAVRLMRGAIESVIRALAGADAAPDVAPGRPCQAAFDPAAYADVAVGGKRLGAFGLITPEVQRAYDLEIPVVAAELSLDALAALYPPRALTRPLPAFPSIERDLSFVVAEETAWAKLLGLVERQRPELLERTTFVGTYRGAQTGPGKKSVTMRLRFRAPDRTLRHEEVDPQVESLVSAARTELGAELRS